MSGELVKIRGKIISIKLILRDATPLKVKYLCKANEINKYGDLE